MGIGEADVACEPVLLDFGVVEVGDGEFGEVGVVVFERVGLHGEGKAVIATVFGRGWITARESGQIY